MLTWYTSKRRMETNNHTEKEESDEDMGFGLFD
jgi:ribosomal protein L12E/L44/L45/RPP1/RPP2